MCKILLIFCVLQSVTVYCSVIPSHSENSSSKQQPYFKYTVDELLNNAFPKKTSDDLDLDPCKADEFLGDIAIPHDEESPISNIKKPTLQEEVEQYKQEVLEGLQIEEEGLTDYIRKKTKQPVPVTNYNDPFDSLLVDAKHKNGQILKPGKKKTESKSQSTDDEPTNNDSTEQSVSEPVDDKKNNSSHKRRKRHQNKRRRRNRQKASKKNLSGDSPIHEFEPNFDLKRKNTVAYDKKQNRHIRVTRAATARKERVWDYGVIPYEIDGNFSGMHKALFKQAMKHWENFTCVKFVERNRDEHQNYIIFTERPCGCCSFVGKRGNGGQAISIGKNCDKFGIVVHELGHVVGFWHEHTRPDRDKHVNIIRENIMSGQEYNFNKLNEEEVNSLGLTYDYDSIMHYARNTFSKGTYLDTIQPIDVVGKKRPEIGQRIRLSEGDIAQTNLLYKCPNRQTEIQATEIRLPATRMDVADGAKRKKGSASVTQSVPEPISSKSDSDAAAVAADHPKESTCPKRECGRTYQANSATFSSPAYTENIPEEGIKCEWRITATHGERIVLNVTSLDIEKSQDCKTDYIEVRDGYWHKSQVLGLFCGTGQFHHIVSKGSRMLVTYVAKNPKGHRGFTANYEAICGGDLTLDNEGHLESPNYPEEYQPNKECIWRITVTENHQIALRFQSFDVENHDSCVYDYVEIRDGLSLQSPILKVFCGQKVPSDVISTSNEMLVKFVSDGSVQKGGFSAIIMKEYDECSKSDHGCAQECINTLGSYACTCKLGFELHSDGKNCENACGGLYEVPNGTISSPSFPDLYPMSKKCIWEIVAKPLHKIRLNFTHFDIEGNNNPQEQCEYDRIEIFSKRKEGKMRKHGSYCGTIAPGLITSDGEVMRIIFYSDISIQKTGFAAVFFTDLDECATNQGGCQHECLDSIGSYSCACHNGYTLHENGRDCREGGCKTEITAPNGAVGSPNYPDYYPARKDCVWHLTTTPGHRIRISFLNFELEPHQECSYDHLDFYDGPSPESPSLGRFCGSKLPHMIISSGNQLFMSFRSDASVQRSGFWATHSTVCGGMLQASSEKRHIYSHTNFGTEKYAINTDCDWTIEAKVGHNVKLSFLTFDLEDEKECGYDYVEIFSGMDSSGPSYGKYCGTKKPFDIISTHESLLVRFKSDGSLVNFGFSIVYEAVEMSFSEEDEDEEEEQEEEEVEELSNPML